MRMMDYSTAEEAEQWRVERIVAPFVVPYHVTWIPSKGTSYNYRLIKFKESGSSPAQTQKEAANVNMDVHFASG